MYPLVCLSRAGVQIALILTGGLCVLPAHATTYFVATNGSNTNPGTTTAAPFQTIQHAATNMVAGDTCFIRDGVYRETLAPSRSGISSAPITFGAYSNEVVTLDGADAVTGWTFLSNGIYQASVNWDLGEGCNQVFVDGAMMREAQYPDYGSGDVLHPATVSVTVDSVNTNLITSTAWGGQPDNYWAGRVVSRRGGPFLGMAERACAQFHGQYHHGGSRDGDTQLVVHGQRQWFSLGKF